jgi:hypothetical protein
MDIEIRGVSGKKDLRTFIYLPEKVHADHPKWVHPIYMDDWSYFDPAKNKAFAYCDTILLLAWRGAECVGRVMGIINHRYNEHRNEKTARFGFLETRKDPEAVRALLGRIEDWARGKGMTRIVGPYGFSDQDPEGFMIEAEHGDRASITISGCPFVEDAVKDIDYSLQDRHPQGDGILQEDLRAGPEEGFDPESQKSQFRPYRPILNLMNET